MMKYLYFTLLCQFILAQISICQSEVIAFSLNNWKEKLYDQNSSLNNKIIPMHEIWFATTDSIGDIILVGERHDEKSNSSKRFLTVDQVVLALRARNQINSLKENPGVSIQPYKDYKEREYSEVVYYGKGIENTDFGRILLESDILLKLLGEGFINANIENLPREIDLHIDNMKSLRRAEPLSDVIKRSYFYPKTSIYSADEYGAAISSFKISIENALTSYTDIPNGSLSDSTIINTLKKDPLALSPLYTHLLNEIENFEKLKNNFPVLQELQNILSLAGIFHALLKNNKTDFSFWDSTYVVEKVNTPKKIPALTNSVNGLAFSYGVKGGIRSIFEEETNWWNLDLRGRFPEVLKDAALKACSTKDCISWIIPIHLGDPSENEWQNKDLDSLQAVENAYRKSLINRDLINQEDNLIEILLSEPLPVQNPNWKIPTDGENVFITNGSFFVGSEESEYGGLSRYWRVGTTDLRFGANMNLQWVYKNKLSLKLRTPLVWKWQITDVPSLPGIADPVIAFKGGIESPTFNTEYLLFDGLDDKNRWKLPMITLQNNLEIPISYLAFKGFLSGKDIASRVSLELPFGNENWYTSHGITATMPVYWNSTSPTYLKFMGAYVNSLAKENRTGEQFILRLSSLIPVKGVSHLYTGFDVSTSFLFDPSWQRTNDAGNIIRTSDTGDFIIPGVKILGSISVSEKYGINTFSLGWSFINQDWKELRGGPILQFNLSGHRLWDFRRWY